MKNLSPNQEPGKTLPSTEFDSIARLPSDPMTIDSLDCTLLPDDYVPESKKIKNLLEQKAMLAIEPHVLAILEENKPDFKCQSIEQINLILQKVAPKMSSKVTCYSRAGKAYLRIDHEMGDIGNLFFKSLFYNLLKDFDENCHVQMQENTICAIYRI